MLDKPLWAMTRTLLAIFLFFSSLNSAEMSDDVEKVSLQNDCFEFLEHAKSHLNCARWVQDSDDFYKKENDFRILFADGSKRDSENFLALKSSAEKNYQEKKLRMCCWQFIFLVLFRKKDADI